MTIAGDAAGPVGEADKALHDRLRRAEGQLRGVVGMLEGRRPCEEVVTQLLAVRAAVDRVAEEIVLAHVDECLASLPPEQLRQTVGRALRLLEKVA